MASYIVTDRIRVNIIHSFAVPPRVKCEQYDGDYTRLIQAIVYNGDVLYTIPSAVRRIVVSGLKPDNTGFSYDCTWSGNTVSFSLMRQMTAIDGKVPCNITMFDASNNQVSSAVFVLDVEKAALPSDVVVSSNDFQTFVDYVQAANLYWQYSKSYAVGNTGVRENENVDNAKYYAHLARMYKGSPLTASTVSAMIDTKRVYVYVGNESGYNNGHWYFYNDTAWVDGGVYNSEGIQTDTELIAEGVAADAKAVGDILGHEELLTKAITHSGAINELKTNIDNYKLYNILDYADLMTNGDWSTVINAIVQMANEGITIYIPEGTYNCQSTIVINHKKVRIVGENRNTILDLSNSVTSFIDMTGDTNACEINTIELDCNYMAQYGIYSADWCSEFRLINSKIGQCTDSAVNMPVYLSKFDNVWAYNCPIGFKLPMYESTRGTSTTMNTCYASDCTTGFDLEMSYSTLIDCASDRNDIGYFMRNCYGVNMVGCGAERSKIIASCNSWFGGNILGFYGYENGDASYDDTHFLFDFKSAVNINIGGYYGSVLGTPKLLRVNSSSYGSENVNILDYSIRKNQISYVSNYAFKKPIRLNRGDDLGDDRTISFDNITNLSNYLRNEMPSHIDYTLTINITADLVQTSATQLRIYNISGSGRIVFNLNGHTITTPTNDYKIFRLINCNVTVCITNGTLANAWNNNNQQLIETVNGKLSLKSVTFYNPTGYKAGSAVTARDGSFVIVGSDCVKNGVFESDGVYNFLDEDDLSYIVNKATF